MPCEENSYLSPLSAISSFWSLLRAHDQKLELEYMLTGKNPVPSSELQSATLPASLQMPQQYAPSYPHLWASPSNPSVGARAHTQPKEANLLFSEYHGLRHRGADSHPNLFILQMALEVTSQISLQNNTICAALFFIIFHPLNKDFIHSSAMTLDSVDENHRISDKKLSW